LNILNSSIPVFEKSYKNLVYILSSNTQYRSIVMKRFILTSIVLILMSFNELSTYREIDNSSFDFGEKLEYRVHYGMINAAEATMEISDRLVYRKNRPCYKVDVWGRSVGLFDLITRINDNWGTYIDTAAIIPHGFYRILEEGRYRKFEYVDFDHQKKEAVTTILDKVTKEPREKIVTKVPENVQDMVSGYYYIRTLDFSKIKEGDAITIDAFFDVEQYDFKVRYLGKETVRTKIGKFRAVILQPLLPKNGLFTGEDAIKIWISDDANKIPLKVKASMFVGAVEIDIVSITGARNGVPVLK